MNAGNTARELLEALDHGPPPVSPIRPTCSHGKPSSIRSRPEREVITTGALTPAVPIHPGEAWTPVTTSRPGGHRGYACLCRVRVDDGE